MQNYHFGKQCLQQGKHLVQRRVDVTGVVVLRFWGAICHFFRRCEKTTEEGCFLRTRLRRENGKLPRNFHC